MSKTKSSASNSYKTATFVIYLFLFAALGTYFLPLQSIKLPALGKKSWSVQDIVKTLPKGAPKGKAGEEKKMGKFNTDFDFMDFVKEITPKKQATGAPVKISPEFIFGALVPVALILAYFFVVLSLFLTPIRKGSALIGSSLLSVLCSAYVLVGTYYLSSAAQRAFSSSLAKVEESPFGIIAKNFVQQVSIQPETGLYALVGLTVLVLVVGFYRRNQG